MKRLIKKITTSVVLLCLSISINAQSTLKFSSTFTVNQHSDFERLNQVREIFDSEMIRAGAEVSENEGAVFLIGLSKENEEGYVALSITSLYRLPENIIQAGKYGQVFYSGLQSEGIQRVTEDGNMIRDKISEDYLRQFLSIGTNKTLVIKKENLRKEIKTYVSQFSF